MGIGLFGGQTFRALSMFLTRTNLSLQEEKQVHDYLGCSFWSMHLQPRGSIYTIYGIRPQKNHPCFGFGDLIP